MVVEEAEAEKANDFFKHVLSQLSVVTIDSFNTWLACAHLEFGFSLSLANFRSLSFPFPEEVRSANPPCFHQQPPPQKNAIFEASRGGIENTLGRVKDPTPGVPALKKQKASRVAGELR